MNDIIIIGKHGQLSRALASRASEFGLNIIAAYDIEDQDLSAPESELRRFAKNLPQADGIIIAAAFTAVDVAEADPVMAHGINALAPEVFAQECVARGIPLTHVSTDYVFNGENDTPWQPDDKARPLNVYGQSKLDGENAIKATGARAAIHRTSWVYDGFGKNFMRTMLRLAKDRDTLNIVNDQIGRPTYAGHLADACLVSLKKLIDTPDFSGGTYHVSNTGQPISWADFATAIFDIASDHIPHNMTVNGIPSSEYPTPAKRPMFSVMDVSKFETVFKHKIPSWNVGLKSAYHEWLASQIGE